MCLFLCLPKIEIQLPASTKQRRTSYSCRHLYNYGDAGLEKRVIYRLQAALFPVLLFMYFGPYFCRIGGFSTCPKFTGAAGAALRAALAFF